MFHGDMPVAQSTKNSHPTKLHHYFSTKLHPTEYHLALIPSHKIITIKLGTSTRLYRPSNLLSAIKGGTEGTKPPQKHVYPPQKKLVTIFLV